MAIETIDNFGVYVGRNIDSRYGPYASTTEANNSINEIFRFKGLTVLITGSGNIIEYWYYDGITNPDLIPKAAPAFLTGSDTQVVFFSGSNQISGSPSITYDYTNNHFYVTGSATFSGSTFLPGISGTAQQFVLTYNPVGGQVYYTASNALSAVSTPLDIRDESNPVISSPTFLNFTGSGVSASISGSGVDIYIPGGGDFSVTGIDGQVVFFSSSTAISGSPYFIFDYTASTPIFNVSGAISASYGVDTVGFYGTASWAESASNAFLAQTASFVTASNVWGPFGSSSILSASYASSSTSASYASSSTSASFALTALFASTASAAPSDTYIQYNSGGLFKAEEYFRYIYTSHSFEQGTNVTAFGSYSYAQGRDNIACGSYSHVEGRDNQTIGEGSHAEGRDNYASASYSHVGGLQNTSSGIYQTVVGQNSVQLLSQSAFIVGGGRGTNDRNNALVVIPKTTSGLFQSDSILETLVETASISASCLYIPNLPSSSQTYVLTYNTSSGQVYYTSSATLKTSLNIQDEGFSLTSTPTFINFTGSGISASLNGDGVDVFVDIPTSVTASFNNLSVWNFTHSLNSRYVIIQALDTEHKQIIPEIVELVDESLARLTFPTSESGYAIASIGGLGGGGGGIVNFNSTSSIIGNDADKSFDIVHNFGTRDLHVTIYENGNNYETVYADVQRPDDNTIRVVFAGAVPPTSQQFIVYISQ